ncbi:hypothetical protein GCM10008111_10880 [Alishewanella tabrizica]|uniref:Uncharacterized protein n=1 Tax=Alishewanella tabrizica TaxID=671278 RepID=A0ABQ2WI58_9ALTE|nr:hypothetical protein GCM10008111_10880 [Alishewanella tabrizica]
MTTSKAIRFVRPFLFIKTLTFFKIKRNKDTMARLYARRKKTAIHTFFTTSGVRFDKASAKEWFLREQTAYTDRK